MRITHWDNLPQSADDVNRKFSGTYVLASHPNILKGAPTVMYLDGRDHVHAFQVSYYREPPSANSRDYANADITTTDLDVLAAYPPKVGAIPDGNEVLLLRRNPNRQWQVGLCHGNCTLQDYNLMSVRLSTTSVRNLFTPVYPTYTNYREILQRFETNPSLLAFAITPTYWLARRKDKLVLYRNLTALGSFVMGTFFVNKACSDLRQELRDDLRIEIIK